MCAECMKMCCLGGKNPIVGENMGPLNGLDLHCVPVWDGLPIFNEIH